MKEHIEAMEKREEEYAKKLKEAMFNDPVTRQRLIDGCFFDLPPHCYKRTDTKKEPKSEQSVQPRP